ncbi:MAG: nicotinamide riboside transporter PnuC [Sarcina sp.]
MQFFKNFTLFQKIFFLFFAIAAIISFFVPLFVGQSTFTNLFNIFSMIGLISSISGVFTSIYQVRASLACYFWWIINTVTYGIISLHQDLYGQFIQNIVIMLPLEIWGFISWRKHLSDTHKESIEIRKFTPTKWILALVVLGICWLLYGTFLYYLPQIFKSLFGMVISADGQVKLDSFTSVTTIFAVYLTSRRYLEQWYFWIVANAGVVLFIKNIVTTGIFSVSDLSGAIVLGQFGIISIYGLFYWLKLHKKQLREC